MTPLTPPGAHLELLTNNPDARSLIISQKLLEYFYHLEERNGLIEQHKTYQKNFGES
jgi:hypothetical protein